MPQVATRLKKSKMKHGEIKELLRAQDGAFWDQLAARSLEEIEFDELFALSSLRKKAMAKGFPRPGPKQPPLRLALAGGCSLFPLHDLVEHLLDARGIPCQIFCGDFDNYVAEITDGGSGLYEFKPDMVVLLPSAQRCKYQGRLFDPVEQQRAAATDSARGLLQLSQTIHERAKAEVILVNLALPAGHDPGPFRSRTLGSDWNFRKWVNLELGLNSPPYVHVCDLEFLAYRRGGLAVEDDRGWFESKQPGSPALLVDLAREIAHLIDSLRRPSRKVLVFDLDNTVWGGVLADDGLAGIELGDTSPRGEAFKAFQKYILALQERGVLLGVCSKNDLELAMEAFQKHPEMVLRPNHIVSFKVNWEPKSENIRRMAAELNLGLDSFVFVDDNPAEIEIVRQFVPEVTTVLLDPDPSRHVSKLRDSRLFEARQLTGEDAQRTNLYQAEAKRQELLASVTDMGAYLESLEMEASFDQFKDLDVPRLAQLINKSNQFNLTTRRRTESEVASLVGDLRHVAFSVRLKDRFGDHGLIAIVVGRLQEGALEIDTWLMSCRVLKRQVEEEVVNEMVRLARLRGCASVKGIYLRTAKNEMVADLYAAQGFSITADGPDRREFELAVGKFEPKPTKIRVTRRAYESDGSNGKIAGHL